MNRASSSYIDTGDDADTVENSGSYTDVKTGKGNDVIYQIGGQASTIVPGEGYDRVTVEGNRDSRDTPGYVVKGTRDDQYVPAVSGAVREIVIETEGDDIIRNMDGSKVKVTDPD